MAVPSLIKLWMIDVHGEGPKVGLNIGPGLARIVSPVGATLSSSQQHGWGLLLAEWEVFVDFLLRDHGFRRLSPVGLPPRASNWCDLFVDGTCAHPVEPQLRYGAWAVTWASGGPGNLDNKVVPCRSFARVASVRI